MTQKQYEKKMESYGFGIGGTGGNCTAFWRELKIGQKKYEVLIANECEVPRVGENAFAEFTDENGNSLWFELRDENAVIEFARTLETN
jgi:hypothetical protein